MSSNAKYLSMMCLSDADKIEINFEYAYDGGKSRTFILKRPQNEEVGKAIERLKTKLCAKLISKKKKKASSELVSPEADIPVHILINSERIVDSTANKDAWIQNAEVRIGDLFYLVDHNPPTVSAITLPSDIMAGFPIFPSIKYKYADKNSSSYVWQRLNASNPESDAKTDSATSMSSASKTGSVSWVELSRDLIYTPTTDDIGHYLQLTCVPAFGERKGKTFSIVSKAAVSAGPGLCPFEHRQLYKPTFDDPRRFRVMSYNILADLYADSETGRDHLFSYCPAYALKKAYRFQLLLKEIPGYAADIMCLQEVDKKFFENELSEMLNTDGYEGLFRCKGGQVVEGCAIFFKKSKFSLVQQYDIALNENLEKDASNVDLLQVVQDNAALAEKTLSRPTVLQAAVLKTTDDLDHHLLVANTHLYFHPRADTIRLIQGALALRHLHNICDMYSQQGKTLSLIFCGDFNCVPTLGVAQLMLSKQVKADDSIWQSGGDEHRINGLEIQHSFDLVSGCGIVPYTNFVGGFHGMLDYIFVDTKTLTVEGAIPPPAVEDLTCFVALPSIVFPSDHIAQVCDLSLKSS